MRQDTFITFVSYTKIDGASNGKSLEKDATIVFTGGSFANSEVVNAAFQSICNARSSAIVKVERNQILQIEISNLGNRRIRFPLVWPSSFSSDRSSARLGARHILMSVRYRSDLRYGHSTGCSRITVCLAILQVLCCTSSWGLATRTSSVFA